MDGLTIRDIQALRQAYIKAQELEQQINRATACGIDCSELDNRCKLVKAFCENAIATYGPFFPNPKQA